MKFLRVFGLVVLLSTQLFTQFLSAELITITSESQFRDCIKKEKPLILDFFANWCSVCKRIKPLVEQLARKYSDVLFVLIDGDKFPGLKKEYRAQAFPTFIFIDTEGKEVDRIVGRDEVRMEQAIKKIRAKKEPDEEPKAVKQETKAEPEKRIPPVIGNVIELTSMLQLEELKAHRQPMMYDFYTTWCGPCKLMKPIIEEELSKEYSDVLFVTIDAERFPGLARQYNVKGYPTFVFLDATGKEVTRLSGSCPKMLMQGKLNQISSKKSGMIVMEETAMPVKAQPTETMPLKIQPAPTETKPIKLQEPKTHKDEPVSQRKKRGRRTRR